jgi:hypothetical protein
MKKHIRKKWSGNECLIIDAMQWTEGSVNL